MAHLRVSASEPRHIRGGAGGAGSGQWANGPLRVVMDAGEYAPAGTNFHGKVEVLSHNRVATALVTKPADLLGWSKSAAERPARRLGRPAPPDGVREFFTKRQTPKITGTGQTAQRWCPNLERGEPYVWASVRAADPLRGLEHRLRLGLRYSGVVKSYHPILAEFAQLLRHHGGEHAGHPLHEVGAARFLDRLENLGWISQDKRAGYHGRHLITVHDAPVRSVAGEPTPDPGDGSGPDLGDGFPPYREDQELNDPRNTQERGPLLRGRDHGGWVTPPADNFLAASAASVTPTTFRPAISRCAPHARRTASHRQPACLGRPRTRGGSPARGLGLALRRIAREIGRQLDTGMLAEDIHGQLTRLRAWTTEEISDSGGGSLALLCRKRPGRCDTVDCVFGFQLYSGAPARPAPHSTPAAPAPPTRHIPSSGRSAPAGASPPVPPGRTAWAAPATPPNPAAREEEFTCDALPDPKPARPQERLRRLSSLLRHGDLGHDRAPEVPDGRPRL